MYYTIYLNIRERVTEFLLPADDADEYRLDISAAAGKNECTALFSRDENGWRIVNDRNILVTGNDITEDGRCAEIEIKGTVISGALFVSSLSESGPCFRRYSLQEKITIGSDNSSDIVISGEFISRKHAEIVSTAEGYEIKNLSGNGIYINGVLNRGARHLEQFDIIWIFGVKLVFNGDVLSVLSDSRVRKCRLESADTNYSREYGRKIRREQTVILRGRPFNENEFRTEILPFSPENSGKSGRGITDILKTAVPASAVLSAAAAAGGAFSLPVTASFFAGGTGLITGTWLIAKSLAERSEQKNSEAEREEYIAACSEAIKEKQEKYRRFACEEYISAAGAVSMYREHRQKISGRSDDDFLKLMLCTGKADFSRYIDISGECDKELKQLAEEFRCADRVPVTVSFSGEKLYFVRGGHEAVCSFIRGMAVKISAFHSFSDVKLCFLLGENEYSELDSVKWLPHVQTDDRTVRLCSKNQDTADRICGYLSGILRLNMNGNENITHCVVFCTDEKYISDSFLRHYYESEENAGITFVMCSISEDAGLSITGRYSRFHTETEEPDTVPADTASSYFRLRAADAEMSLHMLPLPSELKFSGMYEDTEDTVPVCRSQRAADGIFALVGAGENRKPFFLNLHESGHGPHGLIAGTTGSGKSELIQTIILSLALGYSPDEISFVLIDYKGGGMSGAFENLPHVSGVLTNLSDNRSETGRVLVSLSAEIKRRQVLLRDSGVSHVDSYMKLYYEGKVTEPLPHVIIICDEFAELRKEQPEFISRLVSISRVGRSLGMHLILATQRPAGVVDEEIKSNSGFRICLKVQDGNDSIEMLGKKDAAEINITGRAFVFSDGVCELIQTGYSGAEYCPDEAENRIYMTDSTGAQTDKTDKCEKSSVTELEYYTGMISGFCSRNGFGNSRKMWEPPLDSSVYISELTGERNRQTGSGLSARIGITDDPENQKQYFTELDFAETGNILVAGAAGSGKTTLLTSVLGYMSYTYSPDRFRFSVLDFSGGFFSVLSSLHHCDSFLTSPDERQISEFFDGITAETERRKRRFSEVHAADFSEYAEMCDDMCGMLICVDGYQIFRDMYPVSDEYFSRLSGECAKYGIYFVITIKQASDIRVRTRQNFRKVITLSMSDRTEYTELLGIRPDSEIPGVPGRGYITGDRRVLIFQSAVCCSGKGRERHAGLTSFSEEINAFYRNAKVIHTEQFCEFTDADTVSDYISLAEKYLEKGKVLIWSCDGDFAVEGAENFCGREGTLSLLLRLKDIFSQRNTARKISGVSESERITVIVCGMSSFCSIIYESGNESQAAVTEKFLKGGHGLGVYFVSGTENRTDAEYEAYRLFSENSRGGKEC